ncbi:DUF3253 domain-containing protein [Ancylobacter sp. SL191]|uniref:DUF3253 domain-containing protein n=1 Tax=Ancylobacter sp. SL191 TaxID=2995166 RepID=UPI002270EB22|nr:DUF3253 domain-containing protein [Ancylobacter sp. SL191]WAC26705.1 DUF3253 domain-containing protein [Ancylobacter sp. SL191]
MEQAILAAAESAGRTVAPEDVARSVAKGPEWQAALPVLRRVAQRMAREGRLVIYRKGKPVDPDDFRGVYRLGLPGIPPEG